MRLLHGDCLEQMKSLPDNSVDSVVTDPPYGLSAAKNSGKKSKGGFMGKAWDYDVPSKEVWMQVFRVLKPGGHLLSFGGTRTYHRMVVAIEDAGFEIRDQLQWLHGQGFPKSHNLPGGIGTALKPANEPIVLARKPLIGTVASNVEKYGTGGLNIDESRIDGADISALARNNSPGENGWKNSSGGKNSAAIRAEQGLPTQGRWPANVLLDEEAAAMLDEQSGVSTEGSGKIGGGKNKGSDNVNIGGGIASTRYPGTGGASRFFYVAKASKRERNAGLEGMPEKDAPKMSGGTFNSFQTNGGISTITNTERKSQNNHPTVKPIKLMQYLIKLVTPPGGTVLDPFMGSGSTGVACASLGFDFIGIEMNEEYLEIAQKRIQHVFKREE